MAAKEHSPLIGKEHSQELPANHPHNRSYSVLDLEDSAEHSAGGKIMETEQLAKERLFDENNGLSKPKKTINAFGSFALVSNNISGPAMMGLPHLFHTAGALPVIVSIILVFLGASLTGTLLADAIASIPGNREYNRNLSFSKAFKIVVGKGWYYVAEGLFVLSCMVQACASLVETAQSLDGFIASFLLGKTYGIQFLPTISLLEWDSAQCHIASKFEHESSLEDCLPFNHDGSLVFTLGFLLTTMLFLPFGRGQLKEAIGMQLFSFFCFFIMMAIFHYELSERGLNNRLPVVGEDMWQVAGVVLFNFAFTVTVPAWLNEKKPNVSVNKTIWGASSVCSIVFLSFGMLASMSFDHPGTNILVILSSNKVHIITRICSAVFGVAIIGCGVPIFCVIIKTSLYSNRTCNGKWSFFCGALLPYLISWTLYQGKLLITVLNWAGLVVNGSVAFILPLLFILKTMERRENDNHRRYQIKQLELLGVISEKPEKMWGKNMGMMTDGNEKNNGNYNNNGNSNNSAISNGNNYNSNGISNDQKEGNNEENGDEGEGDDNDIVVMSVDDINIDDGGYGHDQFDRYGYDVADQDRDAVLFSFLNLEIHNEKLIFPSFHGNARKTVQIDENHNSEFNENEINRSDKITEYESFPSFANSVTDVFSSSQSDKIEEVGSDYRNFSFLEKMSAIFTIFHSNENNGSFSANNSKTHEKIENGNSGNSEDDNVNENIVLNIINKNIEKNGNNEKYSPEKTKKNIFLDTEKFESNQKNKINENDETIKNNEMESARIIHNKNALNLNKSQMDAISRFSAHSRIIEPYSENVISSLPLSLYPYKRIIVRLMLLSFSLIISMTIIMMVYNSIAPESDDVPEVTPLFAFRY